MGELKPGWKRVKLGEVVEVVTDYWDRNPALAERFVAGEHIDEGSLRVTRWGLTSDELVPPTFNRKFRAGDVLFHSRNLKKLACLDFDGITGEKIFVLRSKDPSVLIPDLLPFLLQSREFAEYVNRMWAGSTNKFLNKAPLIRYELALPPLEEQRRLMSLARSVLSVVETSREALASAERARKSIIADFFETRRRNTIQPNWPALRADQVGDVQLGQQRHPSFETGSNLRPYLRVANVMDGWLDLSDVNCMHFPEKSMGKFSLRDGDILLNEGQSTELVGRSAIYRGEIEGACFQKSLIRFRCGPGLAPEFAQAYFQHLLYTGKFAQVAVQTTAMAHLTAIRFAAMHIPVPPMSEQRLLVSGLSKMGASIQLLRNRVKLARTLGTTTTEWSVENPDVY